jgi:hypothetical protein
MGRHASTKADTCCRFPTREFTVKYPPAECMLGRYIAANRTGSIDRAVALKDRGAASSLRLAHFTVDATDTDAGTREPRYAGERRAGFAPPSFESGEPLGACMLFELRAARAREDRPVYPAGTRRRA